MPEFTTIQVTKTTRKRLNKLGEKGQSHDLFINELLDLKEGKKTKKK